MLWVKAFHLMFMVTWFAGLFYLPRLFVYHAMSNDEISNQRFKVMERKLYYGITTPGGLLTAVFGLWLLFSNGWSAYADQGWMHAKLTLVALLIAYHVQCGRLLRAFKEDRNRHGHVYYRWFNELPVLILAGVIVLVVVRPF